MPLDKVGAELWALYVRLRRLGGPVLGPSDGTAPPASVQGLPPISPQSEPVLVRAAVRRLLSRLVTHIDDSDVYFATVPPQAVVDTAVTLSKMSVMREAKRALSRLAHGLLRTQAQFLSRCTARHLSTLMWAFESARLISERDLFQRISDVAVGLIDKGEATPHDIALLASSFAGTVLVPGGLYSSVAHSVTKNINLYDEQQMSMLALALTNANVKSTMTYLAIADRASMTMDPVTRPASLQHITSIAWALAVQDVIHPGFFRRLRSVLAEVRPGALSAAGFWQLHHATLCLRLLHPGAGLDLPVDAAKTRAELAKHPMTHSRLCEGVRVSLEGLTDVGFPAPHTNHITDEGVLLELAYPDRRIAVFVATRNHFTSSYGKPMLTLRAGSYRRLADAIRWTTVEVPYFEWVHLTSPGAQSAYLQEKLRAAGLRKAKPA